MLKIVCEKTNNIRIAHLSGSIDSSAQAQFEEASSLQLPTSSLIVNLEGVNFMDSAGLAGLVGVIRGFKQAGQECVLAAASPVITKILKITAIDQLTCVESTLEKAFEKLSENS
ncbi:MAG: STAS domain-containing protein [Terriglobia bacterium]